MEDKPWVFTGPPPSGERIFMLMDLPSISSISREPQVFRGWMNDGQFYSEMTATPLHPHWTMIAWRYI